MFSPHLKAPARRGGQSIKNQVLSGNGKQVIEQGNQGQADDGDTSAGHKLYHGELVVKGFYIKNEKSLREQIPKAMVSL